STWMNSGGSFGSTAFIAHLGLGKAQLIKRLEVFWPVTGKTQCFFDIAADQRIVITEGEKKWKMQ
ncbi:MAG: ASPIC/UnbV domain-containing protein, partial [Verrucomicrobiales bacterium]|nr:ASPIC/UnbV domain-containing protein [Verrucomicrobiales bacterium]